MSQKPELCVRSAPLDRGLSGLASRFAGALDGYTCSDVELVTYWRIPDENSTERNSGTTLCLNCLSARLRYYVYRRSVRCTTTVVYTMYSCTRYMAMEAMKHET